MISCHDVRGNQPRHKKHPSVVYKNAPKMEGVWLTNWTYGHTVTMKK